MESDTRHNDRGTLTFVLSSYFLCPCHLSLFLPSLFLIQSLVCVCHHCTEEFIVPGSTSGQAHSCKRESGSGLAKPEAN